MELRASFQTSKGSEGAGLSAKNGNSGFVAKDANNNNVYAGADGNVYKKGFERRLEQVDNGGGPRRSVDRLVSRPKRTRKIPAI